MQINLQITTCNPCVSRFGLHRICKGKCFISRKFASKVQPPHGISRKFDQTVRKRIKFFAFCLERYFQIYPPPKLSETKNCPGCCIERLRCILAHYTFFRNFWLQKLFSDISEPVALLFDCPPPPPLPR